MIERKIGQFRTIRKIGQGGMGVVYEARHESLELRAAVKVMRALQDADDVAIGRFFDEARALSAVQHTSLVRLFDFGKLPDGTVYMMMEYLDGEALSARLSRVGGSLPLGIALPLIRQIAAALAEVHKKGIIHRDLKPANILIVADGEAEQGERAKVLDFGIARFVSSDSTRTDTGAVIGTPRYMSPEQCEGAEQLDDRTDVYALGIVCFELLTGRYPYEVTGMNYQVLMQAHLHQRALPLRQFLPAAPKDLSTLLVAMLNKDSTQRPAMADVAARLRPLAHALKKDGGLAKEDAALGQSTEEAPKVLPASPSSPLPAPGSVAPPRRLQARIVAGLAAIVLASSAVYFTASRLWLRAAKRTGAMTAAPPGMALIAGGSFDMGSTPEEVEAALSRCAQTGGGCLREVFDRERGVRRVSLTPFYMQRAEVTNEEYADFLNRSLTPLRTENERKVHDGSSLLIDLHPARGGIAIEEGRFTTRPGYARKPVVQVTWAGARAYCAAKGYDLPTEAQWELAARGGAIYPHDADWPWGAATPRCEGGTWARKRGLACAGLGDSLSDVGTATQDRTANAIYDLAGNVEEWILDAFTSPYPDCGTCVDPLVLPGAAAGGAVFRVTRGGSWSQSVFAGRAAGRSRWREDYVTTGIGFRCAVATRR